MRQAFPFTERLFESEPFVPSEANRQLFVDSFREIATHHYEHNRLFRAYWDDAGLCPDDVKKEADLERVPPILVTVFKENELISTTPDQIVLTLTSSGTGGQKSQQRLDRYSLDNVKKIARRVYGALGLTSEEKVNYLCFTYDPRIAKDLGTAYTDELITQLTGIAEVYYAIQWDDEKAAFEYKHEPTIKTLERFQSSPHPTRILGFPSFLYALLRDHDLSFDLGERSWVETGGGWKDKEDRRIPKDEFRRFVAERLHIPLGNVRDLFGMVEHGIPYVDCELGELHIPNYARVLARSPKDMRLLPEGEVGLLQFLCSYNTSYPCISLLSTDYGSVSRCRCKIGGKVLRIEGRAGVSKHKGCAMTANEMLRG